MKELTALALIALVVLAGCTLPAAPPQQPPASAPEPAPPAQQTGETQPAPPTAPAALRENDGGSGGDAPDRFVDGLVELKAGEYTDNAVSKSGDVDFYNFTVGPGDWFKVTVTPASELDAQVLIYDKGGKESTWDFTYYYVGSTMGKPTFEIDSGVAGKEEGFWSQMSSERESYTYYFSVGQVKGLGNYTLQLEVKPQDDAGSGKDAGETPSKAVAIGPGKEYTGLLKLNDILDCYRLSTGGSASVTVSPETTLDVSFTVHDHGGKDATWDLTYTKKTNKKKAMLSIDEASPGIPESATWETTGSNQFVCVRKTGGYGNYTLTYS